MTQPHRNAGRRTLIQQHRHDRAGRAVAKQLAQRLVMIGDAVPLNQSDEIVWRVAAKRTTAKRRIGGDKPVWRRMFVGEVAAPAAGDQNLGTRLRPMIQQHHPAAARTGGRGTHQACSACPNHDCVERLHARHVRTSHASRKPPWRSFPDMRKQI